MRPHPGLALPGLPCSTTEVVEPDCFRPCRCPARPPAEAAALAGSVTRAAIVAVRAARACTGHGSQPPLALESSDDTARCCCPPPEGCWPLQLAVTRHPTRGDGQHSRVLVARVARRPSAPSIRCLRHGGAAAPLRVRFRCPLMGPRWSVPVGTSCSSKPRAVVASPRGVLRAVAHDCRSRVAPAGSSRLPRESVPADGGVVDLLDTCHVKDHPSGSSEPSV